MDQFSIFFNMGFEHISDIRGYDHILFILVLCSVYSITEYKKVALLVTAFTLGHSLTLALSACKIILLNAKLVELLIPVTILLTSISNLLLPVEVHKKKMWYNYSLALAFGLIHGMGFSNFFNALIGDATEILLPLFSFNLGLEVGQIMIVATFFALYFIVVDKLGLRQNFWTAAFSWAGAVISLFMIFEKSKQFIS